MDSEEIVPQIYSVSQITGDVKSILESAFDSIWIEGEISNLRIPSSQHAYFILKDNRSQIRCVFFKGFRAGLKFQPEDGDQVLLFGRMTVYESRGDYQLIVERMEPKGLGALQKSFEKLKAGLMQEGLFNEENKKPIPPFPWRVGVVTSATGAAVRDIINIIQRRNPKVSVLVYPVKVQGEGAAKEIAEGIQQMNLIKDLDVLIVGRGGGSIEDLWAFNEEVVARAIYKSVLPIVSAVGHEIDFTITDLVADLRAPTPSAAAELIVPKLDEMLHKKNILSEQLLLVLTNKINQYADLLKRLMERRFFKDLTYIIQPQTQRLDDLNNRLFRGLEQSVILQKQNMMSIIHQFIRLNPLNNIQKLIEKKELLLHLLVQNIQATVRLDRERFDGISKNLNALSPLAILDRGYSITSFQGKSLAKTNQIKQGDSVNIRLSKGQLDCTVDKVTLFK
ncbi:MAG: exodeoxyribonuclease VII large subunit [Nitrospina sp.]|nr:exodeoxyribonuclease VII large subunit [Nitrospina sp.]